MRIVSWMILAFMILMTGCSKVSDEEIRAAREAVKKGALIIDVRSQKEFRKGHVESAVNIPIDYLDKVYRGIPRDKEIVVYCRTGSRSAVAAHLLREQGWTVYDVATPEDWQRKLPPKPELETAN